MTKPLLPTLKEKKRYVAFKVDQGTDVPLAYNQIRDSYQRLFGEFGLAEAGLIFIKDKAGKDSGLIRVATKDVDRLKTAMAFVEKGSIDCIGVSGIVKKAYGKYIKEAI